MFAFEDDGYFGGGAGQLFAAADIDGDFAETGVADEGFESKVGIRLGIFGDIVFAAVAGILT